MNEKTKNQKSKIKITYQNAKSLQYPLSSIQNPELMMNKLPSVLSPEFQLLNSELCLWLILIFNLSFLFLHFNF